MFVDMISFTAIKIEVKHQEGVLVPEIGSVLIGSENAIVGIAEDEDGNLVLTFAQPHDVTKLPEGEDGHYRISLIKD